jgi:hypothetical protein
VVTFQHWAGVRPYATSYEFAGSCVFSKQSPLALCLAVRHPFYQRYGANLPSSFGGTLSSPRYPLRTHTRQVRYSRTSNPPRARCPRGVSSELSRRPGFSPGPGQSGCYRQQGGNETQLARTALAVNVGAGSRCKGYLVQQPLGGRGARFPCLALLVPALTLQMPRICLTADSTLTGRSATAA